MKIITTTELARNLRQILDRLAVDGEELVIQRNHQQIARLLPGPGRQTAFEAMADLYRTLPAVVAEDWEKDSRTGMSQDTIADSMSDPWDS